MGLCFRVSLFFAACALCLFSIEDASAAKFVPRVEFGAAGGSAFVLVNGSKAVELRAAGAESRAKIVAGRLQSLMDGGLNPQSVIWKASGKEAKVVAGDAVIITVTSLDAKSHKTSCGALASAWAETLKTLLSEPPLSVQRNSLLVPLGETRTVKYKSLLPSPVAVKISDPSVVSAEAAEGCITVKALALGNADMVVSCGEFSQGISVQVRRYAAYAVPGVQKALVTGRAVPSSIIDRAVADSAYGIVRLEAGARIVAVEAKPGARAPQKGSSVSVPVVVEASGDGLIPTRISGSVQLENADISPEDPVRIMYSNSPERVLKYGSLFTGKIEGAGDIVRLLYHHQNMIPSDIGFVIDLVNPSDAPAAVHIIEGISRPMVDTFDVGYVAGLDFLRNRESGTGRVVEVPAKSRRVIVRQVVKKINTASGILDLRQLSGEAVGVRVTAKPTAAMLEQDLPERPVFAEGIALSDIGISDHIYPGPVKNVEAKYSPGGQWVFVRLGDNALKHSELDVSLDGNYGVTYNINAVVENTLKSPLAMEVLFEATAGEACGVFLIDGDFKLVKHLTPPAEAKLARFTVGAGMTKTLSIQTVPLSGSFYPAVLVIRPAPGQIIRPPRTEDAE